MAEQVADVLTAAFADDPFMAWLFSDPATRVQSLSTWWRFLTAHIPEGGELHFADGGGCAAMWYPPNETEATPASTEVEAAASGELDPFVMMVSALVGDRWPEVSELFGVAQAAHPDELHWYLAAVGTMPEAQGAGRGQALVQPVLERCDAQGLPVYLESSNPRNLAFYHRLGFEIVGEITTPDGSACLIPMWRRCR